MIWFGLVYGILTFVGYVMPDLVENYILNIYVTSKRIC